MFCKIFQFIQESQIRSQKYERQFHNNRLNVKFTKKLISWSWKEI